MVPASGAAAALQENFADAADTAPRTAAVFQLRTSRRQPTLAEQKARQEAMLEANIAERLARGETIDTTVHQQQRPFVQPEEVVMGQIRVQSDQSIFSSAFAHIPR